MMLSLLNTKRGSGMVMGFFVLLILTVLAVSFLSLSSSSLIAARRDVLRARALACAEAGVDAAISFLMTEGPNGEPMSTWRTTQYVGTVGINETYTISVEDGSGITAGKVFVRSTGTATSGGRSTSRTVEVVLDLDLENVNIWNNVIFGGVGQAGKSINGNVAIRGSVHLLGDGESYTDLDGDNRWDDDESYTDSNHNGQYDLGEPFVDTDSDGHRDAQEPYVDANGNGLRDPALTVTDLATEIDGTANMGNSYDGMPSDLRLKVPDPPQTLFGGETVDTLNAKVRVKHGTVSISGNASVGFADSTGDSVKETMDGTYVSDGFGGNSGTAHVFSDNGFTNGYDLGDDLVELPLIDTGAVSVGGYTYNNYLEYLRSNATVYSGDLAIEVGVSQTITGPNGSLTIDSSGNMTVSGIVYVDGDIEIGPSKSEIIYDGSGTLVTAGSIYVHCDMLPQTTFPTGDALGLIAGHHIELATGPGDAQLTMALAMYAQHKVISEKQSAIAGTIVSSYYEMFNVPRIYHCPDLPDHLPPGMPGADPIWIGDVSVESWREVAPAL